MQDTPPNPEPSSSVEGTATTAASPADATRQPEIMPSIEELLRTAELQSAEHHDAWLRAKAETENVRRRAQDDIAKTHKYASEKFAAELLAVKDSLEAALANDSQDAEGLRAGVELTLRQLTAAFEKANLAEINPLDEKFDPHKHQAISQIEAPDSNTQPNHVVSVLQKGYALHDRILRPALVMVSKPKDA